MLNVPPYEGWLGAGGHVGGEDVVGVAVEVGAGAVVPHGRSGVGVAGGDLDVTQIDAGVVLAPSRIPPSPILRSRKKARPRLSPGPGCDQWPMI